MDKGFKESTSSSGRRRNEKSWLAATTVFILRAHPLKKLEKTPMVETKKKRSLSYKNTHNNTRKKNIKKEIVVFIIIIIIIGNASARERLQPLNTPESTFSSFSSFIYM